MKNKIVQYIPEYIENLTQKIVEFENFDDIKNTPWIKNFSDHPKFEKFEINDTMQILAKYQNGKHYVVGTISNKIGVESINELNK